MFSPITVRHIKNFLANTPLNRNYITDVSLQKRLKETVPYVTGLVLDVGCGEKPYEPFFRSNIKAYIGIDLPMVHDFYSSDVHADVYGNAYKLPFKSASFDTVICTGVLSHVSEPQVVFAEFSRVLKASGVLILTANKSWETRTGLPISDYWRFTDEGLTWLARQKNLEVMYTKPGCGFFATIGQLLSRFLNKEFIYYKATYQGIDKKPNLITAFFILPLCAIIQIFFFMIDKIYFSKIDTLFYILVARKINN